MKTKNVHCRGQMLSMQFAQAEKLVFLMTFILIISFKPAYCQGFNTAIQNMKGNILYIDVHNPLLIVSELEFDSVSYSNGRVVPSKFDRTKSTEIVVIPDGTGNGEGKLTIYNQGTMMAGSRYIHGEVPLPTAAVGGREKGSINKAVLLAQSGVFSRLNDFIYDIAFEVVSFDMSVSDGNLTTTLSSSSWQFTIEQKKILNTLTSGQSFRLEHIRVKGPGGIREISPIILTIQ